MEHLSEPAARGRTLALDGLRGYAAASVVIYHAILGCSSSILSDVLFPSVLAQHTYYGRALKVVLSVIDGEVAVALFFVMSGMVLFRALTAMDAAHDTSVALSWRFVLRRVLRLWPVMALCLVVQALVVQILSVSFPGFTEPYAFGQVMGNLALLNNSVNGVTWTLGVELAAVPWLLLFYFAVRRWGALPVVPVVAVGIVALRHTSVLDFPPGTIIGLPMILAGCVLESGLVRRLARLPLWWLAPGVGAALVFGDVLLVPWQAKLHALILLGGATLLVGGVATSASGRLNRLLELPFSQFLGRISFSLYLWNALFLIVLVGLATRAGAAAAPIEAGLTVGLAAVVLTIPVAYASERWVERPFIRLGRSLTRRRSPAVIAPVGIEAQQIAVR